MNTLNLKNHTYCAVPKNHAPQGKYKEERVLSAINKCISKYDGKLVMLSESIDTDWIMRFIDTVYDCKALSIGSISDYDTQGMYVEIKDGYTYLDFLACRYENNKEVVHMSGDELIKLLFKVSVIYTRARREQEKSNLEHIERAMLQRDSTLNTVKEYFFAEDFKSFTQLGIMLGLKVDSYRSNNIMYDNPVVNNYYGTVDVVMQNGDLVKISGKKAVISKYGDLKKQGFGAVSALSS